jgi:hypothetical protein
MCFVSYFPVRPSNPHHIRGGSLRDLKVAADGKYGRRHPETSRDVLKLYYAAGLPNVESLAMVLKIDSFILFVGCSRLEQVIVTLIPRSNLIANNRH